MNQIGRETWRLIYSVCDFGWRIAIVIVLFAFLIGFCVGLGAWAYETGEAIVRFTRGGL